MQQARYIFENIRLLHAMRVFDKWNHLQDTEYVTVIYTSAETINQFKNRFDNFWNNNRIYQTMIQLMTDQCLFLVPYL